MGKAHVITGSDWSFNMDSTEPSPWRSVGPFKATNISMEAVFSSGSTVGSTLTLQGRLSTGSTGPVTLLTRASSQSSIQVTSTAAGIYREIRLSPSGGWSTAKTAHATVGMLG